jgi:hypothetical protein
MLACGAASSNTKETMALKIKIVWKQVTQHLDVLTMPLYPQISPGYSTLNDALSV